MGIPIPIYGSGRIERAPIGAHPMTCPRCAGPTIADVALRWRVVRIWGLPMVAHRVATEWTCRVCGEVIEHGVPPGVRPPFRHRYGAVLTAVAAVALMTVVCVGPRLGGDGRPPERGHGPKYDLAEQRARAAMADADEAVARCRHTVEEAIARAVPGRFFDLKAMRPTEAIDAGALPRAEPHGGESWSACTMKLHSPNAEDPDALDAETRAYREELAAMRPPERFLAVDVEVGDQDAIVVEAVITLDGRLLAVATARGKMDPSFDDVDRQLARWKQPPR
jgi:hypothetical protein